MIPKLEKLRYEKINLSIIPFSSLNNYSNWVKMYSPTVQNYKSTVTVINFHS